MVSKRMKNIIALKVSRDDRKVPPASEAKKSETVLASIRKAETKTRGKKLPKQPGE